MTWRRIGVCMKLFHLLFLTVFAASGTQDPGPAAPDPQATLRYIHAAWDQLDALPDRLPLAGRRQGHRQSGPLSACGDRHAARRGRARGKVPHQNRQAAPPHREAGRRAAGGAARAGLLYLPNPYVVPGGRFNEMYGWDSYFIVLGLEADHKEAWPKAWWITSCLKLSITGRC